MVEFSTTDYVIKGFKSSRRSAARENAGEKCFFCSGVSLKLYFVLSATRPTGSPSSNIESGTLFKYRKRAKASGENTNETIFSFVN